MIDVTGQMFYYNREIKLGRTQESGIDRPFTFKRDAVVYKVKVMRKQQNEKNVLHSALIMVYKSI